MNSQKASNSIDFNPNDLVLIIGNSMGENCAESVRFARAVADRGDFGQVLFINTVQRQKKLTRTLHETLGPEYDPLHNHDGLFVLSSQFGDLASSSATIRQFFQQTDIRTIVVNSWEMSAGSSRSRERLLFQIQHWLCELDATVIVYAQESSATPKAGYAQRGGFGKLAGLSDRVIVNVTTEEPKKRYYADLVHDESDDAEIEEQDEDLAISRSTINPNGTQEYFMESSVEIEDDDAIIRKWDAMEIPRLEPRIYFPDGMSDRDRTTIIEERFSRGRILMRTISVATSEYDFPQVVPTEDAPEVGLMLEEYLDDRRRPNPVRVHSDVAEMQEVTDQISGETWLTEIERG